MQILLPLEHLGNFLIVLTSGHSVVKQQMPVCSICLQNLLYGKLGNECSIPRVMASVSFINAAMFASFISPLKPMGLENHN